MQLALEIINTLATLGIAILLFAGTRNAGRSERPLLPRINLGQPPEKKKPVAYSEEELWLMEQKEHARRS